LNRRKFIENSIKTAGVLSVAPIAGCQAPKGAEKINTDNIRKPLDMIERENLKIIGIKVTPMSYVPEDGSYLWIVNNYVVWKTDSALVEVFTDQGITGIAEGTPYGNPMEIKKFTENYILPVMIGKNPFDVDYITAGAAPRDTVSEAAWAGINNACWDIIGKSKGKPVYELLATDCKPKRKIPIYASGGVNHKWYEDGETQLIEEALRYKEQGYTAFKFRNGTNWEHGNMTMKKYLPILRKLREAVGPNFKLMIEKHNWNSEEIIEDLCPVLEDLKFYWYEEPMSQWTEGAVERHLKIKEAMPSVMISGGERFSNRFQLQRWIAEGAYDIIQSDCNLTGISENWHISRMANLYGRLQCPHNWHGGLTTISNIHFVAGSPNGHMCEINQTYNPFKEGLFKDPLTVVDGYMSLPDKPGFGVELIEGIDKKFPWVPGSYLKQNPLIPT
jgi:L-alanine-DL-glutamate epimerase-like enolase superfamily enzyme